MRRNVLICVCICVLSIFYNVPANAGFMHARSVIGLGVSAQFASEGGIAHAERHQGSKYRVSHEEFGNNYTYGNAGTGHAHHHSGLFRTSGEDKDITPGVQKPTKPPKEGSPGTSQYIKQTWLPNASGLIEVTWTPDSFLQIDPSDIALNARIVTRATISAGERLSGSVELIARRTQGRKPAVDTRLTGIFKNVKFEVVTHPNGVISLRFKQPLRWTVKAKPDTFDIALEGSIEGTDSRTVPTEVSPTSGSY